MHVALITVGDELLAGDTINTNAAWLGRQLADRGASVERITVVPDRVADIAQVVNEYHAAYDAVIVTGGIGPTHDDVTMDGVAAAFGRELTTSERALEWLEEHGGYAAAELTEGTADIPDGARFLPNPNGVAPGCVIDDVYVLPGVPEEMKGMFTLVGANFHGEQQFTDFVYVDGHESELLDRIEAVREQFDVTVGSYPGDAVRIKLSGPDEDELAAAAAWLRNHVDGVVDEDEVSEE